MYKQRADALFDSYAVAEDALVKALERGDKELPAMLKVHLHSDTSCRKQFGNGNWNSGYSCTHCQQVGRFCDLSRKEREFTVEIGRLSGQSFIVSEEPVRNVISWWEGSELIDRLTGEHSDLCLCGSSEDESSAVCRPRLQYFRSDVFSHSLLINWIIERATYDLGWNGVPSILHAFRCGDYAYKVRSKHLPVDANNLTEEAIRSLVIQLIAACRILGQHRFVHGNPGLSSLRVVNEPCNFAFDGITVEGPYTLQLFNFERSIITIGDTVVTPIAELWPLELVQFHPTFRSYPVDNGVMRYKLGLNEMVTYQRLQTLGLPLYKDSYDFYAFLISLMSLRPIREAMFKNRQLLLIWAQMWVDDEGSIVRARLEGGRSDIAEVLDGVWLRCDIVPYLWNLLRSAR